MRKVYVEVYCEISSAYFVHLWIHNYQRPALLKKKNVVSQFFSNLYATKKYVEIILQAITQPVRLSRYIFFFFYKVLCILRLVFLSFFCISMLVFQFSADLVTCTEETLNEKLHFLYSGCWRNRRVVK